MRRPTATPRAVRGAARAATIAAERSSWMPPAKNTSTLAAVPSSAWARKSSRTASWASHRGKLPRGPTWPPHSEPSKTNLRAPLSRNCRSNPGDGTWRKVRIPARSNASACDGRPPAMIAWLGRSSRTASSWAFLTSSGAKPSTPTPQGRPATASRVPVSRARVCAPFARARARNGRPPPSATAAANPAWSLTLVIGPWATGSRVPSALLIGEPSRSARAGPSSPVASRTTSVMAPVRALTVRPASRQCSANRAARKPS